MKCGFCGSSPANLSTNACLLHVCIGWCGFQKLHCTPGLDIVAGHHRIWVCAKGMPRGSYSALSKTDLVIRTEDYDALETGCKKNDDFGLLGMEFV